MPADLSRYKDIFLTEARAHLEVMDASLLNLEKSPETRSYLSDIFRAAHTLKSAAASMKYASIETLCHAIEDVLDAIRKNKIPVKSCVDTLFSSLDALRAAIGALERNESQPDTAHLIRQLESLEGEGRGEGEGENAEGIKQEAPTPLLEKLQTIPVKVDRVDRLMNLVEELVVNKMRLIQLKETLENPELSTAVDTQARLVGDIQYNVTQVRMVPLELVFNRFPRMVRDLAQQQKKEVDLKIEGGDIELDRAIIDEVGEALIHLLRNALDHGIESREDRQQKGKSLLGLIKISVFRSKDSVAIEVADDGCGLDLEEVKRLGISRGILSPKAAKEEVLQALFSGLSTAKSVTTISGRGLGLDIVKRKIESLGGTVRVATETDKGTSFFIEIPLSLAIIKTLFVKVGGKTYAIALSSIDRIVAVGEEEIKGILEYEAIVLDGEDLPITRLSTLFGIESPQLSPSPSGRGQGEGEQMGGQQLPVVVVRRSKERLGLVVDELLATEEIVIKPLNRLVRKDQYFAGSAIIGTGEVILVLDVAALIFSTRTREVQCK